MELVSGQVLRIAAVQLEGLAPVVPVYSEVLLLEHTVTFATLYTFYHTLILSPSNYNLVNLK